MLVIKLEYYQEIISLKMNLKKFVFKLREVKFTEHKHLQKQLPTLEKKICMSKDH